MIRRASAAGYRQLASEPKWPAPQGRAVTTNLEDDLIALSSKLQQILGVF
jgi:hypothetical protein